MTQSSSLVQGRSMGVPTGWVVPVGIFSCVQQGPDDACVTELGRQGKSHMTVFRSCCSKKICELRCATESGRNGKIHLRSVPDQRPHRIVFVQHGRYPNGAARVCPVLAEQIDELDLYLALAWDAACGYQHKSFVSGCDIRSCLEDDAGHVDDIGGQFSMANRVFGYELE